MDNFQWFNHLSGDKKWELMAACDLAAMPSTHEPFGIVALEWMGLGVPLIVSAVDGLNDFCDSTNAVMMQPSTESLVTALRDYEKSALRTNVALNTAKSFTWQKTAERTKLIYESLL